MQIFQPDILPFNIAIIKASELESKKSEFTDEDGNDVDLPKGSLGCVFRGYHNKHCYSIIVFSSRPTSDIIAHEAFHSACDLLENIGIQYDRFGNNEIFAYTLQYIVRCINQTIEKESWE